ncbi:MraY family glycosyltransferase [Pirellulaceae bacterium SH467]
MSVRLSVRRIGVFSYPSYRNHDHRMANDWKLLICLVAGTVIPAAIISWWIVGWVRKRALVLGLMDLPNDRKVHTVPIPRGGGIGIALGVCLTFAIGALAVWGLHENWFGAQQLLPESLVVHLPGLVSRLGAFGVLLGGGVALAILGLFDDLRGLPWQLRLAVEFLVAGVVVYWQNLQLTAYIQVPWLTSLMSVFWIVLLINSFNMLDNMDALSSGVAAIICVMLSAMLLLPGGEVTKQPQLFVSAMLLTLLGALLGFLRYNWPPASIFMGDSGSYFVGYWIAITTLLSTYVDARGSTPHAVLAPLCFLAIPIYDTFSVVLIRLREGRSPFQADKRHFSHRLVSLGLSKRQAVWAIYLATITCSLGALLLPRTDLVGAVMVLFIVICMLFLVSQIEGILRRGPGDS